MRPLEIKKKAVEFMVELLGDGYHRGRIYGKIKPAVESASSALKIPVQTLRRWERSARDNLYITVSEKRRKK